MSDTQRNFLILGAVALLGVVFAGPFGEGAGAIDALLMVAFTVLIVWALVLLYMRHSGTIALMPAAPRLILQAAGVVLLLTLVTGTISFVPFYPFGWASYGGSYTLAFWTLVLGSGFAIWWSWQQRTSGW